jgi:hypothetical protein
VGGLAHGGPAIRAKLGVGDQLGGGDRYRKRGGMGADRGGSSSGIEPHSQKITASHFYLQASMDRLIPAASVIAASASYGQPHILPGAPSNSTWSIPSKLNQ